VTFIGLGEAARRLGVSSSRLSRLFSEGRHAEPGRVAGKRAIPVEWLPELSDLLRSRLPSVCADEPREVGR
jgi:hypothetical protein